MTTLQKEVTNLFTKFLLQNLPAKVHEKYDVDAKEFETFLTEFMKSEVKMSMKTKRPQPKGTNGKGRVSGFLMFSNENRSKVRDEMKEKNPEKFENKDVSSELGARWRALNKKQQAAWNAKADAANEANGLGKQTPTPQK